MRKHAPIIIFAFNRLETLKRCVTSLQKNTEAKDSDLFVFVDGVRPNIQGEQEKIKSVREYVKTITGFVPYIMISRKRTKGWEILSSMEYLQSSTNTAQLL